MGPKKGLKAGSKAAPAAQAASKPSEVCRWVCQCRIRRWACCSCRPTGAAAAAAAACRCLPTGQSIPACVQGLAQVAAAYLRFCKSPASLKALKKAAADHPSALAELCLAKAALLQGVQAATKVWAGFPRVGFAVVGASAVDLYRYWWAWWAHTNRGSRV